MVSTPPTSSARIWIAISGIVLLKRLITFRKRLVMSSATITAMCSYWGYRVFSMSQYSIVRMMWVSSVAPSWISTS